MICRGVSSPPDALAVAARLQKALARTVAVDGRSVPVSASVGVTMAVPGSTLQALLSRADEAMYQSKRQRDRTPVFLRMPTDRIPAPASAAETPGRGWPSPAPLGFQV